MKIGLNARSKLKLKYFTKMLIRKSGFRLQRLDTLDFFEPLLYRRIRECDEFFFIQIGANDGVSFDPLHAFLVDNATKVKGIVMEPLKDVFRELKHNYRKYPQIIPVNAALHNSESEMTIYRVDPNRKDAPPWMKGIGSFNERFHELSNTPRDYIIEEKVNCISLSELIRQYSIERIDLLQLDTEGYDFEIVTNINFDEIKPQIIHFEHGRKYNTMSKDKLKIALELLQRNGYHIAIEPDDVVAYLHDLEVF
jgi:FkbM family methyltransferase